MSVDQTTILNHKEILMNLRSKILKISLFATGLSGIVAEYILATLATYFLGDSVFQWTMIVSVMMFSMGLGSHLSKYLKNDLLNKFIYVEFTLSILVGFSSMLAYVAAAYTDYTGGLIYIFGILIGMLVGMEIPLVIRVNNEFESLRINVSSVMQLDYYGSLAGGMLYAFVALPRIGLTYTPFVIAAINFAVAVALYAMVRKHIATKNKRILDISTVAILVLLGVAVNIAKPIVLYGEQKRYTEKIILSKQTRYQKIVLTQWKDNYWLFINGNQQLCTMDEVMYHEPLVHPAMKLSKDAKDILVLGGGDGCAIRELLKYPDIKTITLVDLDSAMTNLGRYNPVLAKLNQGAYESEKVKVINTDGFNYLESTGQYFDIILIDLPDPKTVELGRLYSYEFYKLCRKALRPNGILVTQAGSPYYATDAFRSINKSMAAAGFSTQPLHTQILTLGEWGWILGTKHIPKEKLKPALQRLTYEDIPTKWINNEAMLLMTSFGKNIYVGTQVRDSVEVNTIHNPVLYHYYLKGNWDLY